LVKALIIVSSETDAKSVEVLIAKASGASDSSVSPTGVIRAVCGAALKRTLPERRKGSCGIVMMLLRISSRERVEKS
jgi:hypothetical protein